MGLVEWDMEDLVDLATKSINDQLQSNLLINCDLICNHS